jgi:Holliday junction resolvase-like predicted endonuclease
LHVVLQVGVWAIDEDAPQKLQRSRIDLEADLERWLEAHPSMLSEGLSVVGRQVHVDGGYIDLLCLDVIGRWVVVELKRERLYRDAVAQALDYAHSIQMMDPQRLRQLVANAGVDLSDLEPQFDPEQRDVMIIVAGAGTDAGLERVVQFLARYDVPIRVVSFDAYRTTTGQQLLVREVIDEESATATTTVRNSSQSVADISNLATDDESKRAFDRIVAAAEAGGLYVRPYKVGVMLTPSTAKNRYLAYVRPQAGHGLFIHHGPEQFTEFFPDWTVDAVIEQIGLGEKQTLSAENLEQRVRAYESYFPQLVSTSTT